MRAKPEMKPWVNRGHKNKSSVGAALTGQVLVLRCGCAAHLVFNKCVLMIYPGRQALGYENVWPLLGSSTFPPPQSITLLF